MRDLIILPSWLVVNPSPEPEVTEPFWSEWFSDQERSDEVTECLCDEGPGHYCVVHDEVTF